MLAGQGRIAISSELIRRVVEQDNHLTLGQSIIAGCGLCLGARGFGANCPVQRHSGRAAHQRHGNLVSSNRTQHGTRCRSVRGWQSTVSTPLPSGRAKRSSFSGRARTRRIVRGAATLLPAGCSRSGSARHCTCARVAARERSRCWHAHLRRWSAGWQHQLAGSYPCRNPPHSVAPSKRGASRSRPDCHGRNDIQHSRQCAAATCDSAGTNHPNDTRAACSSYHQRALARSSTRLSRERTPAG